MTHSLEAEFKQMEIDRLNYGISFFKTQIRDMITEIGDGDFVDVEDIVHQLKALIGEQDEN